MFENAAISSGYWLQWGTLAGASLAAAITDVRWGRIPNRLTLPLWLLGLVKATWLGGAGSGAAALGVGLLLGLPYVALYLLGKGGAGDAKLMAAIGAWLSLDEGLIVLCCVATTGMILAILRLAPNWAPRNRLFSLLILLHVLGAAWSSGAHRWGLLSCNDRGPNREPASRLPLPYGLAIFVGVCIGAVGVRLWIV